MEGERVRKRDTREEGRKTRREKERGWEKERKKAVIHLTAVSMVLPQ